MTQAEQIHEYMKKHGSITTLDAFRIGITRLSARIWDLKRQGVEIETKRESYKARDGKRKHYFVYSLGDSKA